MRLLLGLLHLWQIAALTKISSPRPDQVIASDAVRIRFETDSLDTLGRPQRPLVSLAALYIDGSMVTKHQPGSNEVHLSGLASGYRNIEVWALDSDSIPTDDGDSVSVEIRVTGASRL
jgi:hypothetical protein